MVRSLIYSVLGVLCSLGFSGCEQSLLQGERSSDQGTLATKLHTPASASKADQVALDVPPAQLFAVTVRSAAAPEPVYTSLYADFPYSLNLTEGGYTIEAAQGVNLPFTTENPYYFVQESFEIERDVSTTIELTARLVGFGVEGVFDADMGDHFTSWRLEAEIDNVWDAAYVWAVDGQTPRAYFLPAQVRVILRGVRRNGEAFSQVVKEISSAGRELYTLKIHVLPAGHALSVSVDTERRVVTDQGVVSVDALPDLEAPTVGVMTFYETTTVPTEGTAATAELYAFVGFSDVEVTIPRAGYGLEARTYRWSAAEDRSVLRAAGVDLGSDDLSGVRTATLSAKGLVNAMLADAAVEREYDLSVSATDGTGKVAATTLPIRIERPEFAVPAIEAGACWTKRIYVPDVAITDGKGDAAGMERHTAFSYQISLDGGATWSDFSRTDAAIQGLSPNTEYQFRARFRDLVGAAVVARTEAEVQIPNNNFAQNHNSNGTYACYNFFANGAADEDKWWATRNTKTTSEGVDAHYAKYSGARPTSGAGVELVTHGWGAGSTASGGISTVKYIWAGAVFLGKMNDGTELHGRTFASRPTAMQFDYKYAPYNNKGDKYVAKIWLEHRAADGTATPLASGQINNEGATVSAWSSKTITLAYTNTALPITHLCVAFYSGVNEKPGDSDNDQGWVKDPRFTKNEPSRGSVFYVNNVVLVYDK